MSQNPLSEEEIFEQAFKLQAEARQDFLKRVCRDEQQIGRIEALLKEGAPEASFLEKGPAVLQQSNKPSSNLPDRMGDFEILEELGRGGMGVVYRARQCSLNRFVALKVLSSGLGLSTKAIMRFKLEAEAAAKLHHTNIVPIYWTGEENRVPYYAMELIDGPSLDHVIKQLRHEAGSTTEADGTANPPIPDWIKETLICSSMPANDAAAEANTSGFDSSSSLGTDITYFDNLAKMMAGVADALAHAHNHGIVHRDIKPANLLLSSDGRLSINDFGLARMLEQPGMTMTGELMGSPMYMSPEQITAGRLPLDHRTDIYSLGATLYEFLTLHAPFPGQRRDQVLSQVLHKDPPKPRSINPRIPKDLETICMKAMEKDPDRRYQTAELLAEDLRRFVNRHAISARRVGLLEKGIRWVRKNKAISASVCAILIVLLGVGAFESWRSRNEERENAIKDAQKAVFNVDPELAQAHLNRAVELGMDPDEAELLMSQVHLMEGKTDQAIATLKRLQNKSDSRLSQVVIASLLAQGYVVSGRWGEYGKMAHYLGTCKPATDEERFRMGGALIFVAPSQALKLIESASRDTSGYAEAWTTRAYANIFLSMTEPGGNLNRIKDAEFCLRTARNIFGPTLD